MQKRVELGISRRDGISQNGDIIACGSNGLVVPGRTLIGTENRAYSSSWLILRV